jgi:PKD repeat protein
MRRTWLLHIALTLLIPVGGFAQDCNILSKANDINPDQFCSPVEVVTWEITYVGVNNAGKPVEIYIEWDDGDTETNEATEGPAGTFSFTANHTYASEDDVCNYHPKATLIVNDDLCTSSSQEQIVTVWDNDNTNGGRVNASPNVYPICEGEGATMHFDDGTLFNCVPPQERDVPNTKTRWIQWVYGTRNTMMTGAAVKVDGVEWVSEFEGPVIELTGPVTGSSEVSLPITVADDKLVGQEFEVELRYWNYCNPWPTHDPVTDRSVIRIVPIPDATIDPMDTLCLDEANLIMTAATGGGTWTGDGIVNPSTGEFSPFIAGTGSHSISYLIIDGNSCTGYDTIDIVVRPGPVGSILPVDPFCIYDAPYDLEAATTLGNWTGTGIINASSGLFDPAIAGLGWHSIIYETEPDASGCIGNDTLEIEVVEQPFAEFLTPDSAWCETDSNQTYGKYLITGKENSLFDLVLDMNGERDTLHLISVGIDSILLNNIPGINLYTLVKIIEYHGNSSCDADLFDTIVMDLHPLPVMVLETEYDDYCSPVEVSFEAQEGASTYIWDFGDGKRNISPSNEVTYTYRYDGDTIYGEPRTDTVYYIQLIAETEFGCSDTITDSVVVYPNPIADFFVSPEMQYFPDSLVYLLNLSSRGNWNYSWDFGDGSTDHIREPNQHIFNTWGFYDIELKTFSPYCRDSITKQVRIMPPPPVSSFEPDSMGCPPLDITFRNNSKYADTFIWNFDDGTYSTDFEPTHRFWESKEHHVKLTAYGLSGVDTTYQLIKIHERPTAMFGVYPPKAKNLKQVFKFVNRSNNASRYRWEFGDGTTSDELNPAHIYPDSGKYVVTLYVWSPEGCPDTIVYDGFIEIIAGEGSTEFPNAFVWNGAGPSGGHWTEGEIDNTVFHPHMINPIELKMSIYTRWGEMIWETNEIHVGWDGYLKTGELVQPGVYVYKAWVTYVDGMQELLTGDVTFLH